MFDRCPSISSLNVTNWDVGKVTTFLQFLNNDTTNGLTSLDVSKWNPKSATNMKLMFAGCMNLESLDVSNWDVSNVTTFSSFLQSSASYSGGMKITEIKGIEKWKTSSATDMSWMFYGCSNLTSLNLNANPETGAWDVSKVTNMYHMFSDCMSLTTLNMKGWNTESLTDMNGIFNTCTSLKVIDVSDFDTQNVTDMCQVFETCYALEEIIGLDKWDTSSLLYTAQMFSTNAGYGPPNTNKLKVIDLSSFDTSKVTHMQEMFQNSPELVTIYVGDGWTTENVVDSTNMFTKCPLLVGEKGTAFDANIVDKTYARVDTEETPGYFTHISNKPAVPEQNQ
jgi:surface protein